jgi:dTMP kinase
MINVYFTASQSYNGELTSLYKKITKYIKTKNVNLLSGEQITNKNLIKVDKKLTPEQIFYREKTLIDQADCVIAEATKPSLGVGSEIEYSLLKNKPVLALVDLAYADKLSPIIAGNPSQFLFIEFYHSKNLFSKIDHFISFVPVFSFNKKKRGKFIVIDGADGSGKSTQAQLLAETLKEKQLPVKYIKFPRYDAFHGKTVAQFLRGEFGDIKQVSPYLASITYALDRVSIKKEIEDFLNIGGYVVTDRYASSNMAHQGAKFKDEEQKAKFLQWLHELEYDVLEIAKEDLVIYLDVPWKISQSLTEARKKTDKEKAYLKGKDKDIHEANLEHIQLADKMYKTLVKENKHWERIQCVKDEKLLPINVIHDKILALLEKKKYI